MKRSLGIAALAMGLALPALAQVKLELKRQEGKRTTLTTVRVDQKLTLAGMELPTKAEVSTRVSSLTGPPAADGTYRAAITTEAIRFALEAPGGIKLDYDSDGADVKNDNPMLDAILDRFRALKGKTYTLVLGKDGKVAAVEGVEKILETAPPAAAAGLKADLDPERIKKGAHQELALFEPGPVKKGDQWLRTEVDSIGEGQTLTFERYYEYQGTVEKDGRTLDRIGIVAQSVKFGTDPDSPAIAKVTASDLKVNGSLGTLLFDRARGEVVERTDSVRIGGTVTISVNGMELPGTLDLALETTSSTR
jgi:hypothetical protein